MSLFDDIITGLGQAIEFEKGNLKVKTTILMVDLLNASNLMKFVLFEIALV